eukprot:Pgem_evm1s4210
MAVIERPMSVEQHDDPLIEVEENEGIKATRSLSEPQVSIYHISISQPALYEKQKQEQIELKQRRVSRQFSFYDINDRPRQLISSRSQQKSANRNNTCCKTNKVISSKLRAKVGKLETEAKDLKRTVPRSFYRVYLNPPLKEDERQQQEHNTQHEHEHQPPQPQVVQPQSQVVQPQSQSQSQQQPHAVTDVLTQQMDVNREDMESHSHDNKRLSFVSLARSFTTHFYTPQNSSINNNNSASYRNLSTTSHFNTYPPKKKSLSSYHIKSNSCTSLFIDSTIYNMKRREIIQ